jgi:hypothetical protein
VARVPLPSPDVKKPKTLSRPYVIMVDTREQLPYTDLWPGLRCSRMTMKTGDYGLAEYVGHVAIERKSWDDMYGCFGQNRVRFEQALGRLQQFQFPHVVVEATLDDLFNWKTRRGRGGRRVRSKMPPQVAFNTIAAWGPRYRVPIWFCGNRARAARWTLVLLDSAYRQLREEDKALERMEKKLTGNGIVVEEID